MFSNNSERNNRNWEKYRTLGKLKFTLLFSLYFSLILALVNFFLEYATYGMSSIYMAIIRFLTYLVFSPIMALLVWKVSESKYQKSIKK